MDSSENFEQKSYKAHQNWLNTLYQDEKVLEEKILFRENHKDSLSNARHLKSYEFLSPFLKTDNSWLTLGDCYGTDAAFLLKTNKTVVASDIQDTCLKIAKKINFISEYSKQNAESMTFADNSFDYVFCNEAYHHFPRPYVAVYEMLRVARKAVIIKDAQDPILKMPFLLGLSNMMNSKKNPTRSSRIWKNRFSFEPVGNFVYKTSEREYEKLAMGIGLPAIAFYLFNNPYKEGLENIKANSKSSVAIKYKIGFVFKNFLCKLGIIPYDIIGAILFKNEPDESTLQYLTKGDYKYLKLPKNPYLK